MQKYFHHSVFSFYQKVFDFIVTDTRTRFFNGGLTDEQFVASMQTITEISVKIAHLKTEDVIILSQSHFDVLKTATAAMKQELHILQVYATGEDSDMIHHTIHGYEQAFDILKNYIHIQQPVTV